MLPARHTGGGGAWVVGWASVSVGAEAAARTQNPRRGADGSRAPARAAPPGLGRAVPPSGGAHPARPAGASGRGGAPPVVPGPGGGGQPDRPPRDRRPGRRAAPRAQPRSRPCWSRQRGTPITTVAPSTTACALTTLVTGRVPAEHGVVGYRVALDGDVMNVLQWSIDGRDARMRVPAPEFQPLPSFPGSSGPVPVVTRHDYGPTGFTAAHLGRRRAAPLVHTGRARDHRQAPGGRGHPVHLRLLRRHRQGRPRRGSGRVLRRRAASGRSPGGRRARRAAARVRCSW